MIYWAMKKTYWKMRIRQLDKYITFTLGKEEYAIEIRYVVEIVGLQKIH
jgi:chemotaxis signal transduction protein